MFLDQIITADNSFLKTWKEIKKQLTNKKDPTPKWYKFLLQNLVLNPTTKHFFLIPLIPKSTCNMS
jgi:hypothetical protein